MLLKSRSTLLKGLTPHNTMKVTGHIGSREVTVLIDSGATHNFILHTVVDELGLHKGETGNYGVIMGTGAVARSTGVCKGVLLTLPQLQVVADFLPLDLGSTDVILGMKWLQTLGEMKVNWKLLSMEFREGGRTIVLKGDPSMCKAEISLKTMMRTLKHKGVGFMVELNNTGIHKDRCRTESPPQFRQILEQHADVFKTPQGPPPVQGHEHAIVLRDNAHPVSIRPYRYPQVQKKEIERLVLEMLEACIIQPSVGPFSSPKLVKKKDGS